jgi:N-ethylmaleimide reductase
MSNIDLFTPVRLGPYDLPNRIVMAPMTRSRAGAGNVPQAMNATYYAQRASAGLIITEAAQVSRQGEGYIATPGIHSLEQVAGWKRVTRAVHDRGGRTFLQLFHAGRISHPDFQPDGGLPVCSSATRPAGEVMTFEGMKPYETPHALTLDEIPGVIEQYRQGAENALEAGFDGVEIHAANGYLADQFLRDDINKRTDAYGGSVENRARFLLEITKAVASVWGAERVGVRLSPVGYFNDTRDSDPEALFSHVVKALNVFDLAYLHVTELGKDRPEAGGPDFDFRKLKELWHGLYMANAGYDKPKANAALAAGDVDLVSFATLFLANPDLPERFTRDASLNEPDQATFYGGDEKGYTDYPLMNL